MRLRKGGLIVSAFAQPDLETDFSQADPTLVFDEPCCGTSEFTTQSSGGPVNNGFYSVWNPNLTTSFARWRASGGTEQSVPTGQTHWSLRMYIRYPTSLPAVTPNPSIVSVVTEVGVDDFTFFYSIAQNRFQWDLDNLDLDRSDETLEADRWYKVQARGSYADDPWTAEVRIDDVPQGSISSANDPSTFSNIQFGISAATQQWLGHFANCAFAYGTSPLRFIN